MPLLKDVHEGLTCPGNNGHCLLIDGSYVYYHYKADRTDDVGWGCGYRTLQTMSSWLLQNCLPATPKLLALATKSNLVLSLKRIQETLVEIGDKDPSFVGSKNWIGTFEACIVLDHLYDVPCKVTHFKSGSLVEENMQFMIEHFEKFKSPVMMGGDADSASKCILGVCYNQNNDNKSDASNMHLLVLDPHFYAFIMSNPMRKEVVNLYKQLLYLGRDYPLGGDYFRKKLKSAFLKNREVTDPETIKKLIDRGNYVIKELEALYMLRKYRTLKKRYYEEPKK
eukprot:gene18184-19998_t